MKKVVIITGASSGIGEQLKLNYERDGHTVINFSVDVQKEDNKNFRVDVSNRKCVFDAIDKVYSIYNQIDVLVNCAGYGVFGAVELLPEQKCRQIFDVNYFGTLWCCQAVLKYMKSGGKIVNIASAAALFAVPFRTMYSSSKSAVLMLSFGLRMELKSFGIDVVALCPGDIKTNFSKNRDVTLETNNKYNNKIQTSSSKIAEKEHKRMDKVKASLKIYKIITKKRNKAMYIIGKKIKFLNFAQRFITKNKLLNITQKSY